MSTIHVFEKAGLGVAPFRLVRVEIRRFKACPECPSQPGASCDYCGEGIVETCIIRDAQGKEFKVGNVCVGKTGDRGLIDPIKRELNRLRTEERNRKADEKINLALARLESDEALRATLNTQPHPYNWLSEKGLTALDYVNWMLKNGGRKGRGEAAKVIEKYSVETLTPSQIADALEARQRRLAVEQTEAQTEAVRQATAEALRRESIKQENAWILEVLKGEGGFVQSMRDALGFEVLAEARLTGRQLDVLADIYGKSQGRYNSEKYWKAIDHFWVKAGRDTE